jgi:hypothetical protein
MEDEVSLKDIGVLTRYIPSHHSKAFVMQDIGERVDRMEVKWSNAPPFKLIHSQPNNIKIAGKSQLVKTHEYSVQVLSKDATIMNQFLRMAYATKPIFMPYNPPKSIQTLWPKLFQLKTNSSVHATELVHGICICCFILLV